MSDAFAEARERMVARQLAARDISDPRVLDAMRHVPRHRFVAPEQASEAYADYPLSIGHGQTISQPYIVAYMVEQLRLTPASRVLEIGTGCGYHTAVLARVAGHVCSIRDRGRARAACAGDSRRPRHRQRHHRGARRQ